MIKNDDEEPEYAGGFDLPELNDKELDGEDDEDFDFDKMIADDKSSNNDSIVGPDG